MVAGFVRSGKPHERGLSPLLGGLPVAQPISPITDVVIAGLVPAISITRGTTFPIRTSL
jgi:hypothetical protein